MAEALPQQVADKEGWTGKDLQRNRNWEFELSKAQCDMLVQAMAAARRQGLSFPDITRSDFPLPNSTALLNAIAEQLQSGFGFALLHGFPVDGYSNEEIEIMYWGLCSHIGTGMTQNGQAGLIHYVTDGALKPSQGTRGVGFPKTSPLHVDLMDIVSLLCVRQAPDDPPSRVGSAVALHHEIAARDPAALARLYEGYAWDRMEEHGAQESLSTDYKVPVFSQTDGLISCRYNRHWMASAAARQPQGLPPEDAELFDLVDAINLENCFEFPFHSGDIQFCNNYSVFHGRAAHKVVADENRKRVLMRIWLNREGLRSYADEARVRYGVGYHGQLGWTAEDIRQGRNRLGHPRLPDGTLKLPAGSD